MAAFIWAASSASAAATDLASACDPPPNTRV
jgi:hypothetical protein